MIKLSYAKAEEIRHKRKNGCNAKVLAKEYDVCLKTIYLVLEGKIHTRSDKDWYKLSKDQAEKIKRLYFEDRLTQAVLAKRYQVSQAMISRIVSGKSWSD